VQRPVAQIAARDTLSECPHIFEVSRPKASHPRKSLQQVTSQPVDYLCSPSFRFLTVKNVSANAPIEQYEFPIDGQSGAHLRAADSLLQFLQERVIPVRQLRMFSLHD
jgi:hypothetical protein